ncbi:cytochrome c oxidase subunit 4 isoform 1, mitochondrial-like [Haematobia irritans]|uniref:cytochrome c oxidase subunit 4 isoform 1, mitochondrial-like n=1 Tax=Haematobia irritans TaxID=7368 RepID=UPI003F508748
MALQTSKYLLVNFPKILKCIPGVMVVKRNTSFDYTNTMCGKREYVGFGVNGSPTYCDLAEYPMPAIRFREPDATICALREKEKGDWKQLSKEDIKTLYRYSFCQTFAEFKAPTGEWKMHLGIGLWACAVGILFSAFVSHSYGEVPETFKEDRRQAQLKRIIALEINPITGISSNWDYEIGDWK